VRSPSGYTLLPIATTGEVFTDFSPYVAAISDDGVVAFQAALRRRGSGVYTARPQRTSIEPSIEPGPQISEVLSHPAINAAGACAFYGATRESPKCVVAVQGGRVRTLAPAAGPLGPTINAAGSIAFRAPTPSGGEGIYRADSRSITPIAETGPLYSAFHGLPVIDDAGRVLFRADLTSAGQAVVLGDGESQRTIAATGDIFTALSAFPAMNAAGTVGFCAVRTDGAPAAYALRDGDMREIVAAGPAFESIRGVLLDAAGRAVFYATPRGGRLGVFSGPDPRRDSVLSIGSALLGSTVAEFALNPVSINSAGQLAVRVALADGRQWILRADPSAPGEPASK